MTTRLIAVRAPTAAELADPSSRAGGAEVVFVRRDREGRTRLVFAATCYGSYQQWGETRDVLADNVEAVTVWAEGMAAVADLIDEDDDFEGDDAPAEDDDGEA
ncbi:hypothetical protein CcrMagneto_gp338 [Caulobacter virus Magneto]|uniref:hypothetical protein n=1 Tax=Caulobacter virus Magneto TaxID=1211642 RepID=UPI00028B9899|nr:hypothetical protein CcrMagneto_gp010 [Caulobacter virus Magneto]YP_006989020.1 hypothetical protein CcrMagneto_gp338 [Caulobacter virus Magneto]AFU87180.1 hypothetical protein CcrMagneto_gp010 [Caulobacter virus Magneto]AFU87508.1 hypothetical protein CcrMagneto_gp338 [Caulobacter virus Magneto]